MKRGLFFLLAFVGIMLLLAGVALAGPVIVLDPGHSGSSVTTYDPTTRIMDREYDNGLENHQVYEVAVNLKAKLEAAGYTVLVTKNDPHDTVTKRERVALANDNHASLAVSIHTSGHVFGGYGLVFVQRRDGWRGDIYGNRWYFNDPRIAALSAKYGQIFVDERRKIEYSGTKIIVNSFDGRGLAPGNLPIVQLWSQVPWVYNEAGVMQSQADEELYAQSLYNSITAAIPLDSLATDLGVPELGAPCAITGPTVWISTPADGSVWRHGRYYYVKAAVARGAVKVKFYINGVLKKIDISSPFTYYAYYSRTGTRTIRVVAYDAKGHAASDTHIVTVK